MKISSVTNSAFSEQVVFVYEDIVFLLEKASAPYDGVISFGAVTLSQNGIRSFIVFVRCLMMAQRYIDEIVNPQLLPYLRTLLKGNFHQKNARPNLLVTLTDRYFT